MKSYILVLVHRRSDPTSLYLVDVEKTEPSLRLQLESGEEFFESNIRCNDPMFEVMSGKHPAIAWIEPPYIVSHICEIICN